MKLLILGGSGFIGRNLACKTSSLGINTSITYYKPSPIVESIPVKNKFQLDLDNHDDVKRFFQNNPDFTHIVFSVGYVDHSGFFTHGSSVIKNHVFSLINLISCINLNKLQKFIYLGSGDEYGMNESPVSEFMTDIPNTPYVFSKLTCTLFLQMLNISEGFPSLIFRIFLAYGPNQSQDRLIPYIINSCKKDETFTINNINYIRDFIHIDDLTNAIVKSFTLGSVGSIYNLGSGDPTSLNELVDKIIILTGGGKMLINSTMDHRRQNPCLYADMTKTITDLKWSPMTNLTNGLLSCI